MLDPTLFKASSELANKGKVFENWGSDNLTGMTSIVSSHWFG